MNAMLKPVEESSRWFCAYCFGKRFTEATARDEFNRPICTRCAGDPRRELCMPSFVLDHILELES